VIFIGDGLEKARAKLIGEKGDFVVCDSQMLYRIKDDFVGA